MNKLLIASAAILALGAGTASAADLGKGFSWDTEWTSTYNVSDDEFISELETGLAYEVVTDLRLYGMAYVDVKETEFTSSEFGVSFTPSQLKVLEAKAYMALDKDFENEKFFVEAVVKY